ncbi:hypothetical protein CVT26_016202 [Gymnopilus dilepis]|uniref:Uncharacterized protein n=1 Tax=Gymnopilus dilepis TaxID=231916 RepID=A0A409XZ08_9AGAR|nr:hypothetical protein CVT26_016202 [Gymnopilus dilepis]
MALARPSRRPSGPASTSTSTSTSAKATPAAEVINDSAAESDSGFEAQIGSSMSSLPIPPGSNTRPKASPIPVEHLITLQQTQRQNLIPEMTLSSATIPRQHARVSTGYLIPLL